MLWGFGLPTSLNYRDLSLIQQHECPIKLTHKSLQRVLRTVTYRWTEIQNETQEQGPPFGRQAVRNTESISVLLHQTDTKKQQIARKTYRVTDKVNGICNMC